MLYFLYYLNLPAYKRVLKKSPIANEYLTKVVILVSKQLDMTAKHSIFAVKKENNNKNRIMQSVLHWKAKQMELVELVYALHASDCFEETTLKELFENIGMAFGREMNHYSRLFWDVRGRKGDRLPFIKRLRDALDIYLQKADERETKRH
jgi:ribosomal protein L17